MNKKVINIFSLAILAVFGAISLANAATYTIPPVINDLLETGANWLSIIAGGLAVIFIIVGGINFMTAAGDQTKITKARDWITWAFVGVIIVFIAQVFLNIAKSIGTNITGSST